MSYQYYPPSARPVSSGAAIAALVFGIISIFANLFFVPGIIAIVLGRRERAISGAANAGYILGIIGTILTILLIALYLGYIR
ncbi:MAG TPA: hypothetical protein VFW71_02335 [Actinomycetota bacterium]|nr:hypothetical protein [Actinomycetota bacterium]